MEYDPNMTPAANIKNNSPAKHHPAQRAVIAIVGRANVGKSTLLNRLAGRPIALTHDAPGMTRDIQTIETELWGFPVSLSDSAGIQTEIQNPASALDTAINTKIQELIAYADVNMMLIDARSGITPMDTEIARLLRRQNRPVVIVANKCEGHASNAAEAFQLGLGEVVEISAAHGLGMDALYEALHPLLASICAPNPDTPPAHHDKTQLRLAVVGRPNVGKSTLINQILGTQRQLTGTEPGITRDAITFSACWNQQPLTLIDTAGLRRKARVHNQMEKLSAADTIKTIKYATTVLLMLDAQTPLEKQDLTIAHQVLDEGRCLVLALNKTDLTPNPQTTETNAAKRLAHLLPQAAGIPCIAISARTGNGLIRLHKHIYATNQQWNRRIPTAALNTWLQDAVTRTPPPAHAGLRPKLRYITQTRTRPPGFVLFSQRANRLPPAYVRYLTNDMRNHFNMWGTPMRMFLRKPNNPYDKTPPKPYTRP